MELIDQISKEELAESQQISRKLVKDILELLSSREDQLQYQRDVSFVNITGELVCMWFDDSYHPEDKIFISAFSEAELQALTNFNGVFRKTVNSFRGDSFPQIEQLVKTSLWTRVVQTARKTLEIF